MPANRSQALCRTRTDDPFLTMEGGLSDRGRKSVTLTAIRAGFGRRRPASDDPNTPTTHPASAAARELAHVSGWSLEEAQRHVDWARRHAGPPRSRVVRTVGELALAVGIAAGCVACVSWPSLPLEVALFCVTVWGARIGCR